jgi:hypothetical protein
VEYFVEIIFEGLNPESEDVDAALSRANVDGVERFDEILVTVGASLSAADAVSAARLLIKRMGDELPAATPYRVARELVNTSEIADRIGVSRQAVRNWSSGERRDGSFPPPMDVVGDQKVWEWGTVNAWLRFNLGLDDGLFYPSPWELGEIDAYIRAVRLERTTGVEWGSHWEAGAVTWSNLRLTHAGSYLSFPIVWATLLRNSLSGSQHFVQQDAPRLFVSHAHAVSDHYSKQFKPSSLTVPPHRTGDLEEGESVAAA